MTVHTRTLARTNPTTTAPPTRQAPVRQRRTAAHAAHQAATAIAHEITHHHRTHHLTHHARILTKALTALGITTNTRTGTGTGISTHHRTPTPPRPVKVPGSDLSHRELQVLIAISHGKPNAHIGRELLITEDTVKTHTRRLYHKLHAHNRAHATAIALRQGLIT